MSKTFQQRGCWSCLHRACPLVTTDSTMMTAQKQIWQNWKFPLMLPLMVSISKQITLKSLYSICTQFGAQQESKQMVLNNAQMHNCLHYWKCFKCTPALWTYIYKQKVYFSNNNIDHWSWSHTKYRHIWVLTSTCTWRLLHDRISFMIINAVNWTH